MKLYQKGKDRNMRRAKLLSWSGIIFLLTLIAGCASFSPYGKLEKSARENYVQGNYDQAVFDVVQSLKQKPDYDKSQELVKEVFPKAIDDHLTKIQTAKSGTDKFRWDAVVSNYEALIKLNQAIKSLPTLTDKKTKKPIRFELVDYTKDLTEAKNNAAEAHYQEGVHLSKKGTSTRHQAAKELTTANTYVPGYKDALTIAAEGFYQEGLRLSKMEDVESQKQAAKEFKEAMSYVAGYKDSASLYERARKRGIKRIAIIPFEEKSGKRRQYGAVAEEIVDGVVSEVMNDSSATEFLEIVSRDQLEQVMSEQKLSLTGLVDEKSAVEAGKILGVHEILTGQITNITVTPERTTNKRVQDKDKLCREVVVGYDKKGNKKTNIVCDVEIQATVLISS